MSKKIILRFRDLITENDGTINDHHSLINEYGEVWWGWWMKQQETPPREVFKDISIEIKNNGFAEAYLFNSGLNKFYKATIVKILLAPKSYTIGTPDPKTSPTYYHRGSYPAWFLITNIEQVELSSLCLKYVSFPTLQENKYDSFINNQIKSFNELAEHNVTLWVVEKEHCNEAIINHRS